MDRSKKAINEQYIRKLKDLTIFKQLKYLGEEPAIAIIESYIDCFHRYMSIPDTKDIRVVGLLTAINDIKFDNSYIVFTNPAGEEWLRVHAPC